MPTRPLQLQALADGQQPPVARPKAGAGCQMDRREQVGLYPAKPGAGRACASIIPNRRSDRPQRALRAGRQRRHCAPSYETETGGGLPLGGLTTGRRTPSRYAAGKKANY